MAAVTPGLQLQVQPSPLAAGSDMVQKPGPHLNLPAGVVLIRSCFSLWAPLSPCLHVGFRIIGLCVSLTYFVI